MKPFFRKRDKEAELQEELQFHLDEEAEARVAVGIDPRHAHLAARRELGNLARVQEETRAACSWTLLDDLAKDLRYALRAMAGNKAFSALAVLSLALGIGANTAIFSFMDAILLRSLPVPDPASLVTISYRTNENEVHGLNRHDDSFLGTGEGFGGSVLSWPALEMFRRNDAIFQSVFGFQSAGDLHLAVGNQAEVAATEFVTGNYFQVLGVPPAAGRLIMEDDDQAAAPPVAVISHAVAQRRFPSPADALGQSVLINNHAFTVVGVTPPGFFGADPGLVPEVYLPFHANLILESDRFEKAASAFADPNYEWVIAMARLRPELTLAQAQSALAPQFSEWMRAVNTERTRTDLPTLRLRDGRAGLSGLRQRYSRPLVILLIVVGLILAIACANIANLLLARAASRRREIAVRLSIGAGRFRIVRQLLTESILLSSLGGALGIVLALWGIRFLTVLLANGRENYTVHADINWHVLLVVAGLSLLTGTIFGLAPALQSTRLDLLSALKESRASGTRFSRLRRITAGHALMVAQIAVGMLILAAAGLFLRTLSRLESIELGFNRESVLTFSLNAAQAGHPPADVPGFYEKLRARLAEIPGVRGATISELAVLGGRSFSGVSVGGAKARTSFVMGLGPGFFNTMQIPMLMGREIQPHDISSGHLVAVVSRQFVQKRLNGRNSLGQFLSLPHDCATCAFEIVGVADDFLIGGDVRDERGPAVFVPLGAAGRAEDVTFELRTAGNPLTYVRTVRELVRESDPRLPLSDIRTQAALVDSTMNREVIFARLCTGFALLALAIACVGLYGAMSYNVARRTGEIGIRMALGARRGRVIWMVLREVLALVAAGLVVSIPFAAMGTRLIQTFLFETKPTDPAALGATAACLVAAALLAGFLPARNAARIDPMTALRHE